MVDLDLNKIETLYDPLVRQGLLPFLHCLALEGWCTGSYEELLFPCRIGNRLPSLRPGAVIWNRTKTLIGLIGFKNLRSIGFSSSCAQWAYCFCLAHCSLPGSHWCNISHLCTARVHSRLPSLGAFLIITRSFYLCASLLWHIAQILGEDLEGKKKKVLAHYFNLSSVNTVTLESSKRVHCSPSVPYLLW